MQRVVIDCQTGQVEVIKLSIEEESNRISETEQAKELIEIQRKVEVKQQLVRELAELREMKLNRLVFTDEDIAEKQAEVDSHLVQLGTVR